MATISRPTLWRPSVVCELLLRFEDGLKLDPNVVPPTPIATDAAAVDPLTASKPTPRPLFMDGQADRNSQTIRLVPKTWNIEFAGYRQAGKFSATFDWNVVRVDPRTITSAAIEFYAGSVDDSSFSQGMTVPGSDAAQVKVSEENLMMVGSVDNWSVKFSQGAAEVSCDGRDLRGIFLDSPADSKMYGSLDLSQDILHVVRQILDRHPMGNEWPVAAFPDEWPGGKLPTLQFDGARQRGRKGASGDKPAKVTPKSAAGGGDTSYWDVISYACYQCLAIPLFVGRQVLIRRSRKFYDLRDRAGSDPSIPTPFAGQLTRKLPTGEELHIRRVVYGADIKELSLEKKLQGKKGVVFELRSYNQSSTERGTNKLIKARWPDVKAGKGKGANPNSAATTMKAPSGKGAASDVIPIYIEGVTSTDVLKDLARQTYEEATRGELGGSFTTVNLASQGGANEDPDLLRIRPGDPIEILLRSNFVGTQARSAFVADLLRDVNTDFDKQVAIVAKRLRGDVNLAKVIVASARSAIIGLGNVWRTKGVKLNGAAGGGISISVDFENYLQPIRGVDEPINTVEDQKEFNRLVALKGPLKKQILTSSRPSVLGGGAAELSFEPLVVVR